MLAAQSGRHSVMLEFPLHFLAPLDVFRVVGDKGKVPHRQNKNTLALVLSMLGIVLPIWALMKVGSQTR